MEAIISKELLSEILDKKAVVDDISNIELKENTITFIEDYWDEDEGSGFYRNHTINIYELAHKCKEWALSKGYILMSKPRTSSSFATCVFCKNGKCDYEDDLWNDFRAGTEPEAIFKACEWILNQKDSHAH